MGWSDLPPDLVISIASRLPEADDYARFRSVCKSWESSSRGFRPTFFPWLAVIRGNRDPNKGELSFISHASNGRTYKRHVRSPNVDFYQWHFNSNKQGWLVFVLDDGVPIIVNPVTGAQLQHPLPSIYTLRHHECRGCRRNHFDFRIFLVGLVAFATCYVDDGIDDRYHILAVATPGDQGWSTVRLSESYFKNGINSIVFHEADRKYYAIHFDGDVKSFSLLTRCGGGGGGSSKTDFGKVSTLAKATSEMGSLVKSHHLLSYGTNLLQVKKRGWTEVDFEILKYCPDADMWVQVIDTENYLGNNAVFFDRYGVRLLPITIPRREEEEEEEEEKEKDKERFRKNCIYFTHYDEITPPRLRKKRKGSYQYVHYVRIYDVGKGTVERCFDTNIQSNNHLLPAFMWFTPSLSLNED